MAVNKKIQRVGAGRIFFGESSSGLDFSAEVVEAKIVPSVKPGQQVEVLNGDYVAEPTTYEYKLVATVFQNLTIKGVLGYLMKNAGKIEPITFNPNTADGASFTGQVRLDPGEMGGKVGTSDTSKIELTFIGAPTFTPANKAGGQTV